LIHFKLESRLNHIVFLTPGFAQNEQDTTTIPALQLYIKALKQQQPELKITIITFQFPFTKEKYNWFGCEVIPLKGENKKRKQIYIWYKAYKVLNEINKKHLISILHSFWLGECAFVGNIFSKTKNIKHICTSIGQDVLDEKFYFKIFPLKKTVLICESTIQKKIFLTKKKYTPKVISWGINSTDFEYNFNKTIDIIGVGSLIPVKNFQLFIDVIFEIHKKKPLKVVLIGDGAQKEFLQQKINKLQLEQVITLKGLLTYSETLQQISQAKILLHTSNHEGFGMIFAEALQCHTMIVSKEVGCAFASENWQICTSKSEMIVACEKALSTSFSKLENNPFLIEKTVENYLKIYNE
jgi:glycosyltransferase involved in cell wall biosynthesis